MEARAEARAMHHFFLWRFLRNLFFRLCVAILWRFLFLPLGMVQMIKVLWFRPPRTPDVR